MIYSGRPILVLQFSTKIHHIMLHVISIVLLKRSRPGRISEEFNPCSIEFDLVTLCQQLYYPNMNYHQLGNSMTISNDFRGLQVKTRTPYNS